VPATSRLVVLLAFAASFLLGATFDTPAAGASPHSLPGFGYVSPAPGSGLHLPETNIIVRPGGMVDPGSLLADAIVEATGSITGAHAGLLRLSDDGRTITFRPTIPFSRDEEVTCRIAGIRTDTGGELPGAEFTFRIAPDQGVASFDGNGGVWEGLEEELAGRTPAAAAGAPASSSKQGIPSELPAYELSVTGSTAPGHLFVADMRFGGGAYATHLMIIGNDGAPVFHRQLLNDGYDFKVQGRRLTYFDGVASAHVALDANYSIVDTYRCGNGYPSNSHELILLPNGHALFMSYDRQWVDMSAVVTGGNPNATVTGLIIQELDLEKEVVFQWRSWDHFQITDVTSRSLTNAVVDYAHGNSIEPDTDGNLIISSRHMDEITKIDRETGGIIWRLGGKNNQFTFVNDPDRFSQQHSARRLANGHLLLYDNGNLHTPARSRAVEYALDEENRIATLVWQYRNTPDSYGAAMGSVQRLPNGNTIIGWGSTNPTATEVTPGGEKVAELNFPTGTFSYRAFRFEWPPRLAAAASVRSGKIDAGKKGEMVTVTLASDEFAPADVDYSTVRLAGAVSPIPNIALPVNGAPGDPVELKFSGDALLPYLSSGTQQLALTGRLTSGETFSDWVDLTAGGERRERARVRSRIGAFPIEIAVRASGAPRSVVFQAHDVQGRRVARWTAMSDDEGVVAWDGRGDDGTRLRSGIYFVGTEGSVLTERAKVVLVK
jgi:Arylsulfotransferase (ASST)